MDQLWEGQTCPWRRGRTEPRLSCGVQGTYPERPSGRSSPASHCGTGVSGLYQGAPTPPVRSRQPHPQMSLGPAKMGMVPFMCSLLPRTLSISPNIHPPPKPPTSEEIPGPGAIDAHPLLAVPSITVFGPHQQQAGGYVSSEPWCWPAEPHPSARQLTWDPLDCASQTQPKLSHCPPLRPQSKGLGPSVDTPSQHVHRSFFFF